MEPRSASRPASPFARFRDDHARVLDRLGHLESSILERGTVDDDALLGEALGFLQRQFATHMDTEDRLLYPALGEMFPVCRPTLVPLRDDHRELRLMLDSLGTRLAGSRSAARDEQLLVGLRDFVDLLRLHVHREEAALFDLADRLLSRDEADTLLARLAVFRPTAIPESGPHGRRKGTTP